MTTKTPVSHDQLHGMDRSTVSYLAKDWFMQFGMRITSDGLKQVPRKQVNQTLSGAVTALVSIPIPNSVFSKLFAFCNGVYALTSTTTAVELKLQDTSGVSASNSSTDLIATDRWATTTYDNRVFFTNRQTPIHVVNASSYVARLDQQSLSSVNNAPKARYIENYFDHLCVADVDSPLDGVNPSRFQWSDLYNFGSWGSSRRSEADYYDILESDDAMISGITGLKRLGSELFIYTSTGIYVVHYVGLPTVFRTDILIPDVGNDFRYGLVATERLHYFISERWSNIFVFNGQGVIPFVVEIIDFFLGDVNTSAAYRQMTWGYADTVENELVWCYISSTSTTYDKEIVFNLRYKKWYVRAAEGLTAFCKGGRICNKISDLSGTISGLTGTIQGLGVEVANQTKFWGDSSGRLLAEKSDGTAISQAVPYLETQDLVYGDDTLVKELETMVIQAALGTAPALEVYISTRENLDDAITYTKLNQNWIPTLREGRLTLPKKTGRVVRYKFVPKAITGDATGIDNFSWKKFTDFVYGLAKAEK